MKVDLVYDPVYLKHDTGQHVENGRRLEAVISHLEEDRFREKLVPVKPRAATPEELTLIHPASYISRIREAAQRGGGWLDADTVISSGSYEAAVYAAGGIIQAVEAVMNDEADSAFGLVRPPGHHATSQQAMGFCLFNNIAIAARYALKNHPLEKVAIIDFDVHHGNGTQEAFYADPQVMYVSTHQYPHYPGTGRIEETGRGEGEGTTVNIPLPSGCGDNEYLAVFKEIIAPAVRRFKPRFILVSAGYDPHWADELAMMQLSTTGFADIGKIIRELAEEMCQGRTVFCLEGGYNLAALATSIKANLKVMMGNDDIEDPLGQPSRRFGPPDIALLIESIRKTHRLS